AIYLVEQDGWNRLDTGPTAPPSRNWPGVGYDRTRNTLLFFGGYLIVPPGLGGTFPSLVQQRDTWEWADGWSARCVLDSDPCGDSQRGSGAAIAFDQSNSRIVALGGSRQLLTVETSSEALSFNGTEWSSFPDAGDRGRSGLAFDPVTGEALVVGGIRNESLSEVPVDDTRFFDGSTWSPVSTTPTPPAMQPSAQVVFDESKRVWVLAATPESGSEREIWEFDGTTWSQRSVSGPGPDANEVYALAFDSIRRQVVFVGASGQFFALDEDGWRSLDYGASPAFSGEMYYDPELRGLVAINGSDVWIFDGESWRRDGPGPGVGLTRNGGPGGTGAYHAALGEFIWFRWGASIPGAEGELLAWRSDPSCTTASGRCWFTLPGSDSTGSLLRIIDVYAAYDPTREVIVLAGGQSTGVITQSPSNLTQEFADFGEAQCGTGIEYCLRTVTPIASPPARGNGGVAFDGSSILLVAGAART
ncbi:MAG: hypothetical protein AAFQ82_23995, partial [Myxococcota bacterium]